MRTYALAISALIVTGCGGNGTTTVTPSTTQASALAVDDSKVYFVTESGQLGPWHFWRAPVGGGAAVEMGTFGNDPADYVTVNATAVFTLGGDGQLLRWAKSGGAPLSMATGSQYFHAMCLADAYGFIYVCNYENHGYAQVLRQPEDGGGATEVVTADYVISNLAFDSAHVWFTTLHGVFGAPPAGTSGTEISIASNGVIGPIAVDDAHVYVGSQQQIDSADKRDGATLAPMIATSPSYVNQLATDGGSLYVRGSLIDSAGYEHGTITGYAADGSGAALLAEAHGVAGGMVVRGPYVYFTDSKDSTVYRVCK